MTDRADISSSDNSSDAEASEDSKTPDSKTPAAETELSLQEIIARNRERAIQLRAAKRSLPQEPVKLVLNVCFYKVDCCIFRI